MAIDFHLNQHHAWHMNTTQPLHHKLLFSAAITAGLVLIYGCMLKASIGSGSLIFMSIGVLFLLVLPYMAVNFIFTLFGSALDTVWMLAPLVLTAFAPDT